GDGALRRRCLSHRAPGRARLAAGEPADLFGALLCVSVDRLAAGGEGHRAESQQASSKLRFLNLPCRAPFCYGALPARIPLLRQVNSIADGASVHAPAPVQSGDEYPAAVEEPPDLR